MVGMEPGSGRGRRGLGCSVNAVAPDSAQPGSVSRDHTLSHTHTRTLCLSSPSSSPAVPPRVFSVSSVRYPAMLFH